MLVAVVVTVEEDAVVVWEVVDVVVCDDVCDVVFDDVAVLVAVLVIVVVCVVKAHAMKLPVLYALTALFKSCTAAAQSLVAMA